jgi:hypothetical protein
MCICARSRNREGQAMTTDFGSTFDGSAENLIRYDMNVQAAQRVYEHSGLAQCAELTWQLRGTADKRRVDGVTVALQHASGWVVRRSSAYRRANR